MKKITLNQVKECFKKLIGKKVLLEMGYGGVLFLKIGKLDKKIIINPEGNERSYYEGEFELFSDENWHVHHKGKLFIDRWKTNRLKVSPKINQLKDLEIIDFQIIKNKTIISLEKDYQIVISKDKSLRTWSINYIYDKFSISAEGNGDYFKSSYEPYKYKKPSVQRIAQNKKLRKLDDDPIFKSMYKEDMPIAPHHIRALTVGLINAKISSVEENSGDTFSICLNNRNWIFSICDSWQLKQDGKIIADSNKDKFNFTNAISKVLKNKKIISFNFDDNLNETIIKFNSKIILVITRTKDREGEISLWTIFNKEKSFHISAYRNKDLTHIISIPDNLKEKYFYNKKGSCFANSLYALDVKQGY